eukprot:3639737-Pyramimonas_sp.AAC.1
MIILPVAATSPDSPSSPCTPTCNGGETNPQGFKPQSYDSLSAQVSAQISSKQAISLRFTVVPSASAMCVHDRD